MLARDLGIDLAERGQRHFDIRLAHSDPGVAHEDGDTGAFAAHAGRDRAAGRRELDGVGEEVEQHLLERAFVAHQRRQAWLDLGGEHDVGLLGPAAHQGQAFLDCGVERHALLAQLEFAGFELGEVENVVDQVEQVAAAGVDVLGVVGVFLQAHRTEHLVLDHFREADDGVQRRAQFMAHIGQELGLGAVGEFGCFLAFDQLGFDALAVRDVAHPGQRGGLAVPVHQRGAGIDPHRRAVAADQAEFVVGDRLLAGKAAAHMLYHQMPVVGMDRAEIVRVAPGGHFGLGNLVEFAQRGIADHVGEGVVGVEHLGACAHADALGRAFDHTAQLRLGAAGMLGFVRVQDDANGFAALAAQGRVQLGPAAAGARPAQLHGLRTVRAVQDPLRGPQEEIVIVGMDMGMQRLALGDIADQALAFGAGRDAQHKAAVVENDLDRAAPTLEFRLRHAHSPSRNDSRRRRRRFLARCPNDRRLRLKVNYAGRGVSSR